MRLGMGKGWKRHVPTKQALLLSLVCYWSPSRRVIVNCRFCTRAGDVGGGRGRRGLADWPQVAHTFLHLSHWRLQECLVEHVCRRAQLLPMTMNGKSISVRMVPQTPPIRLIYSPAIKWECIGLSTAVPIKATSWEGVAFSRAQIFCLFVWILLSPAPPPPFFLLLSFFFKKYCYTMK